MKLVTVIPMARSVFRDELSYFSKEDVPNNSIIQVAVRGKKIPALVTRSEEVSDMKQNLKTAEFPLKKISSSKTKFFYTGAFIRATEKTARHFACTKGQVIRALSSGHILEKWGTNDFEDAKKQGGVVSDRLVIQMPEEERIAYYKGLIREEFAKKHSVLICLPSTIDIKRMLPLLEKGIKEYTFALHSGLSEKESLAEWKKAIEIEHPILVVASPAFLSFPRKDLRNIIIDREASSGYIRESRPKFDIRFFASNLARESGARFFLGDNLLSIGTFYEKEQGGFVPASPLKHRSLTSIKEELVDMRKYKKRGGIVTISDELARDLENSHAEKRNIFLFSSRRGLAGTTVCNDCGQELTCRKCTSTLVLHSGQTFLCHKCKTTVSTDTRCAKCGSWRLEPLGAGIERVEDEIQSRFPKTKIFRIDSDSVKSVNKGIEIRDSFYAEKGSVLLGTEMALAYLKEPVAECAAVSFDNLFVIPDFRIREKIFRVLYYLRSFSSRKFLIQTRNPDDLIFRYILRGNSLEYSREELSARETSSFPPFFTFIKITREGERDKVNEDMNKIVEIFAKWKPNVYPAFNQVINNKFRMHALIKMENDEWPSDELLETLFSLPPKFTIAVNPDNIL